jgi:hypothetical protein
MQRKSTFRLSAVLLAGVMAAAPVPMPGSIPTAGQAQAQGLDTLFNLIPRGQEPRRDNKRPAQKKNNGRNNNNNGDLGTTLMQGIGAGLLVGGILGGDAAPAIAGTILLAAPVVVQKDMERKYGKDRSWAGCVSCNQRRVLVRPGSGVTTAQQNEVRERVKADVTDTQGALAQLGFYTQKIDGDFGPGTRKAINQFQQSIMSEPTGKLSAEQRRELFTQASGKGFVPQTAVGKAALANSAGAGAPLVTPAVLSAAPVPSIKEFRLAESQTGQLASDVLQFGSLSQVKKVGLLPDGRLEVAVEDNAAPGTPLILQGGAETIVIGKHELSDSWLQISMLDEKTGKSVTLNTIDTFKSADEATTWRAAADQRIDILEKLTGRDVQPVVVAGSAGEAPAATAGAAAASEPAVAALPADAAATPQPAVAALPSDAAAASAPAVGGAQVVKVAVAETPAQPATCGDMVYVSFNFPKPDNPIYQYKITPPDGTIVADNGDSTAYFAGTCVQGKFGYSYVVMTHDEKKKTYGSYEREGSFEITGGAGQCEIDLNNPGGSATLRCS